MYNSVLAETGGIECEDCNYTSQKLSEKLKAYYKETLLMDSGNKKRGNIVFSSKLSVKDAVRSAFNSKNENEVKLRDVAFSLRKSVLNSKHYPLPGDIKLQNIFKGEIDIPEELIFFLTHLIKGPDSRSGNTVQKSCWIKSIAQDIVFAVTGGVVKPSKHLVLGLALKNWLAAEKW